MLCPDRIGAIRIEAEIGRGGMGAVFRGVDPAGQRVAVKLLLPGRAASETQRTRFAREGEALKRLHHPGLVRLLGLGEHEGIPYLVLEWVEGETLHQRLVRAGPLEPREAAAMGVRLAEAIEACHRAGVLHRDLKPANVLLRAGSDAPVLTDFGLANALAPEDGGRLTRTGQWLGTPGYWAPEQAQYRPEEIGPRTDVYGLGAVLYAALTGGPPRVDQALETPSPGWAPPSASSVRPGVPGWLDAVCRTALAASPAARPESALAFARDLRRGLAREAGSGRAWSLSIAAGAAIVLVATGVALTIAVPRTPLPFPAPGASLAQPPSLSGLPPDLVPAVPAAQVAGVESTDPLQAGFRERGWELLQQGDAKGARECFDRVIAVYPVAPYCLWGRGLAHELEGDLAAGERDLSAALDAAPGLVDARVARARLRLGLGDLAGALEDCDRSLQAAPDHAALLTFRGRVRLTRGEDALALVDVERALELEPDLAPARRWRATLRQRQRDWAAALVDWDVVVASGTAIAWDHHHRGLSRSRLGDQPGALEDFSRAVELEPSYALAWADRGHTLAALGRLEEALGDWDRALQLEPQAPWAAEVRARRERVAAQGH